MLVAVAFACAGVFAGPPYATHAGGRPGPGSGPAVTPDQQAARASAKAKATGKPVTVPGSTTPTSITMATPRGTYVLTQTLQPTRVKRGNSWVGLDARLHRNHDGTLSPNATTTGLTISGGGTVPLATMTDGGVALSFNWPTRLPVPHVHGASATYAGVLPGVDLVVTATSQGGFSHVLVVENKAAAANPALKNLTLHVHGKGLTVAADANGHLAARVGAHAALIFAAKPATMWDSATSAGKSSMVDPDLPAAPGVREPGRHAHTASIKTTVTHLHSVTTNKTQGHAPSNSDAAITLTPDAGLLSAKSTVFPVYIDPTWNPQYAGGSRQAWASVSTALPSNTEYKNSFDANANVLQSGHVDGFTARSFIRFGVSSKLKGATIYDSHVGFTTDNDGDEICHAAGETDLWWTGGISTSISWNNQPSWKSKIDSASATNCPNHSVDFNTTSFMQSHGTSGISSVTFGIRAPDESTDTEWEEFYSGNGEATMSTEYDRAPGLGRVPATSPGGPCQTGAPTSVVIGNDDVTFSIVPNDPDGGQLGTEFIILDYGTSTVRYDSGDPDTGAVTTTSGTTASVTIKRSTIEGWHTDGNTKAYEYSWYVITSDGKLHSPGSGTGTSASRCHFTYDPTAPSTTPGLQTPSGPLTLGQQATVTLAPCADALADPPVACTGTPPARYVYQVDEDPPLSVTATGSPQTISVPLHHVGPNLVTVYGLSAGGNPGPVGSATFNVDGPTTPYADGDINGDGNPDLLTNATGHDGLWLGTTDGKGTVGTPTDIGALGTGLNSAGTPADWNGADILHGDFSGHHVQDIVAYYPSGNSAGNALLLDGNGDTTPLSPYVGSQQEIPAPDLADFFINPDGDNPAQLIAAGNASLQNNLIPDLIGIAGDATNGYELSLYTSVTGVFGDYMDVEPLAGPDQTPDGTGWDNYTLTTAQPSGQTVLFALNKTTGYLYESTNPGQSSDALIGTPASTWTRISTPWDHTVPHVVPELVSADVNTAGQVEVWTETGMNAGAYTLSGTDLSTEATTSLLAPTHQWPLTDGNNATTAVDTSGGTAATLSSAGATWTTDAFLDQPVISLDGQSGYLTLPDQLLHSSNTLTLTLSFRADPGTSGILFSTGNDTPDKANPSAMPVMYIGTDGRLYAQFWNGQVRPMISPQAVNDGQWHTATLNAYDAGGGAYHQGLYLDDDPRIGMAGSDPVNNADPLNYVGAGVFSHNTSSKTWINAPGDTTKDRASYFTGQISNVSYYNYYVTTAELSAWWNPIPVTGAITSDLSTALCIDDAGAGTTNGNDIQIYTCNNTAAQNWTIAANGAGNSISVTINGVTKCMDVTGDGTANSTPIQLYTCDGSPGEDWHLDSDGELWNPHSGKCLADPGSSTKPGTNLIIFTCDYASEQNWHAP